MKKLFLLSVLILASLMACQTKSDPIVEEEKQEEKEEEKDNRIDPRDLPKRIERLDIDLTETEKQINSQSQSFAFDFLKTVFETEKADSNIFISPFSATMALAMLDNGAEGDTHKEIQKGLGFEGFEREEQNSYLQKIVKAMSSLDTWSTFESANSIWIRENDPVLEDFKKTNIQYYDAEIRNVDFASPATLDLINGWVKLKTHDRIPKVFDSLSPEMIMCLINTLYFKGIWSYGTFFATENTKDEPFFNQNGTMSSLPMMNRKSVVNAYVKKENVSIHELPFGNEAFSTLIVLPDKGVSVPAAIEQMNENWWKQCLAELQGAESVEVNLKLPRFKIEYGRELNDDLMKMGIKSMFTNADFSLINPDGGLSVSFVKQKTFVDVHERGMEAAAVTFSGMVGLGGGSASEKADFHVNRPFIFFVKEKSTGVIFFAGVVRNLK